MIPAELSKPIHCSPAETEYFDISQEDTVHILRSTLYSDKIAAVVREYSANAWDAHREVGKADVPIQVTLPTAESLLFERFFDANHLAASTRATRAVGLRLGDELVACASFRPSFVDGTPEVARLAVLAGCSVRGAAGKLLSVDAHPGSLFSYSDNRMSRGDVYSRLGWVEEKADRVGYWYVDDKFDNRIDRYSCRKRSDPEYLEIGSTEAEQNAAQGRYRIEDGGIRKWRRP